MIVYNDVSQGMPVQQATYIKRCSFRIICLPSGDCCMHVSITSLEIPLHVYTWDESLRGKIPPRRLSEEKT